MSKNNPEQRIAALRLMNFKGIRGVEDTDGVLQPLQIELRPITLLFGPNSAGKSTILQALAYLREILERGNLDPDRTLVGGEYMDLGGFATLVHEHDLSLPIKIGFVLENIGDRLPTYLTAEEEGSIQDSSRWYLETAEQTLERVMNCAVDLTVRWSAIQQRAYVSELEVSVNHEDVVRFASNDTATDTSVTYLDTWCEFFSDLNDSVDKPHNTATFSDTISSALREGMFEEEHPEPPPPPDDLESLREWMAEFKSWSRTPASVILTGIPLAGQRDALPDLGRRLKFDESVWRQDQDDRWEQNGWSSVYVESVLSSVTVGPLSIMARMCSELLYIGPIREVPDRNLTLSRSPAAGSWARGAGAWNQLLVDDGALTASVNKWLAEPDRLNAGYRVDVQRFRELPLAHPITTAIEVGDVLDELDLSTMLRGLPVNSRIVLREEATGLEVHPHDVGVGISQLLPVVVAALSRPSGVVAVEQPELHIHPGLQVELGDLFAQRIQEFDGIFLLETHSEHLVLRLLRRIRETSEQEVPPGKPSLDPDDVAVQYVESGPAGTTIKRLRINKQGDFDDRWPRGFFEERVEELF